MGYVVIPGQKTVSTDILREKDKETGRIGKRGAGSTSQRGRSPAEWDR